MSSDLRWKALSFITANNAHSRNAVLPGSLNPISPKRGWIGMTEIKIGGIQMCPRICIVVLFQATSRRMNPCLQTVEHP
jgi:hypothetical protein